MAMMPTKVKHLVKPKSRVIESI